MSQVLTEVRGGTSPAPDASPMYPVLVRRSLGERPGSERGESMTQSTRTRIASVVGLTAVSLLCGTTQAAAADPVVIDIPAGVACADVGLGVTIDGESWSTVSSSTATATWSGSLALAPAQP